MGVVCRQDSKTMHLAISWLGVGSMGQLFDAEAPEPSHDPLNARMLQSGSMTFFDASPSPSPEASPSPGPGTVLCEESCNYPRVRRRRLKALDPWCEEVRLSKDHFLTRTASLTRCAGRVLR